MYINNKHHETKSKTPKQKNPTTTPKKTHNNNNNNINNNNNNIINNNINIINIIIEFSYWLWRAADFDATEAQRTLSHDRLSVRCKLLVAQRG